MKKINISAVTDGVFTFAVIFIISLCVMRYFRLPYAAAAVSSALIGIALSVPSFLYLNFSRSKRLLRLKDEKEKNLLMTYLALSSNDKVLNILCTMRDIPHNIMCFYATDGNLIIYPLFFMEKIGADKIAEAVKRFPKEKLVIYHSALSPEAESLCKTLNITTISEEEIYLTMKEKNLLPKEYPTERPKKKIKDFFINASKKANAKAFILSGVGLLIFSLFTLFPIYYIVSGSLLTLFGAALKIIPDKK